MPAASRCVRTFTEVSSLLKSLGKDIMHCGPRTSAEIQAIEHSFSLQLPPDYRQFLGNYGAVVGKGVNILGLSDSQRTGIPLGDAILLLRLAHPAMPLELVPIEDLGNDRFACLVCQQTSSPVVEVNIAQPLPVEQLPELAPCFRDYLFNRLSKPQPPPVNEGRAWAVLEKHVAEYQAKHEYDHAKGGKLPRNFEWRPYRFCIQDVMFGTTVVRHKREENCLEVDVFLTADIPEYDPLAGAQALAAFLLSEAYKCGGTMEIQFTREVENHRVPGKLQELADRYKVQLGHVTEGRILPGEAKALYAALTGFSAELQTRINALERAGQVTMARACYVVHHGVWTKEQVEMIVLGSERPESVLGGLSQPEQRHSYYHDLLHARAALLGGALDRRLAKRERRTDDGTSYDLEDDILNVQVSFDGEIYAKHYVCDEEIHLPWLNLARETVQLPARVPCWVFVRARDVADAQLHLAEDLQAAQAWFTRHQQPTFILVPNDFALLPQKKVDELAARAAAAHIGLMVCPETITSLDADAAERLARSRVLRK